MMQRPPVLQRDPTLPDVLLGPLLDDIQHQIPQGFIDAVGLAALPVLPVHQPLDEAEDTGHDGGPTRTTQDR